MAFPTAGEMIAAFRASSKPKGGAAENRLHCQAGPAAWRSRAPPLPSREHQKKALGYDAAQPIRSGIDLFGFGLLLDAQPEQLRSCC